MFNIKKFINGLRIVAKTTLESDQKGELEVRDSDGKLVHHNGSTRSPVVTEDHASTGADRLKNKELDSATVKVVDGTDTTKKVALDVASATASTQTTLDFNQTTNRTIIFPDADTTLVGRGTTDTLTNKSIDADNNTISNLEVDNLKSGVLDTDLTSVSGADDTIPSAKAVKTYVDDSVAGKDEASEISYDNSTSGLTATQVQAAIDEVEGRVDTAETNISNNATAISDHLADAVDAHDASAISFNNATSGLTATEVQAAIDEVEGRLDTAESSISTNTSNLTTHESDTSTHGITSAIVGTDEAQTLINKTITGASIQTPIRSDVKQDTLANLQTYASTASNGQLVFATDVKKMFQVKDSALSEVSGGGSLDVFSNEDFETLSATSFSSGNNSSYLTAGTFGGTLSNETGSPISKNQSPKYTAGASSTNDWFDVKTINVDEKQKGEYIGVTLYADMTNFSTDVDFVVYDRTNSAVLTSTGLDILVGGSDKQRYSFAVQIPSTCSQISFGCQMKVAPVNAESFIFDDVEFNLNPFQYKDLVVSDVVRFRGGNGYGAVDTKIRRYSDMSLVSSNNVFSAVTSTISSNGLFEVMDSVNNAISVKILKEGLYNLYLQDEKTAAGDGNIGFSLNSTQLTTDITAITADDRLGNIIFRDVNGTIFSKSTTAYLRVGDIVRVHGTGNNDVSSDSARFEISGMAQTEHVITPMKSPIDYDVSSQLSGTGWTILNARAIYYKTGDGSHWITFTVKASKPNDTYNAALTFAGITPSYNQAIVTSFGVSGIGTAADISTSGNIAVTSTSPTATGDLSGTIRLDSKPTWAEDVSSNFLAAIPIEQVAYLSEVQPIGTNGGTATANTVHTRTLNTVEGDTDIVTLSSNQFTLKTGKYDISAIAPAFKVDDNKAYIWSTTRGYLLTGTSIFAGSGTTDGGTLALVEGLINVVGSETFELRHYTNTGSGGNGLGTAVSDGVTGSSEVYSKVKIRKLR